jgi:glycyl-tRNA synthetase
VVKDQLLPLLPRDEQVPGAKATLRSIGEAVATKMVDNETLGYYLARIYAFLLQIGIKPEGFVFSFGLAYNKTLTLLGSIRFRQHRSDEMAHYAQVFLT